MKLIFATNNHNKVREMQIAIGDAFQLVSLKDAGIDIDIPEPHDTLEENAKEKSTVIHRLTGLDCFSEDTGLEVDALGGEPGVKSARYAHGDSAFPDNISKLLHRLQEKPDRKARFRTVISLILEGEERQFEGICEGRIHNEPSGSGGFGYDPVFSPENATKTFAEMDPQEKNLYSHRRKAADSLVSFLRQYAVNIRKFPK
ncbi:MAG: RdgB/HAM1 family non-canonical purine NTP pyrophosphatase [Gemmatimonadaceae bacterium]|nr:RdgB/HAM1 family non-canonical purine NTP pyrophosphatase [Chitinophagaceae bacterium]